MKRVSTGRCVLGATVGYIFVPERSKSERLDIDGQIFDSTARMTKKLETPPKPPDPDRRSGEDRRRIDTGPPGKRERRRNIEARKPETAEIEMSDSEWGALQSPWAPTE